MRYKVVPEPLGLDTLEAAHAAMPLVPGSVEDCCLRLVDRTAVPARDSAREWVTFMQALDVVAETPQGYKRRRVEFDPRALGNAFQRRVFGAREVLATLDAGPATVEEVFESLAPAVPEWERDRHTDWEREWRERTRRLLEWGVAFGLVVRDGEACGRADGPEGSLPSPFEGQ
jgi:hypothetical protein